MTGSARLDPAAPPVPVGASYVELAPQPRLRRAIRTVWVQRTGAAPYVQTHLPTGGTELHLPFGGAPRLVGPLTGPLVEVLPPRSTLVGVRFLPGAAPGLWGSTHELVDQQVELSAVWGDLADRLGDVVAAEPDPFVALDLVQHCLVGVASGGDDVVAEAVHLLMPWSPLDVTGVADRLTLSPSQLRRRLLHVLGVPPKALQRTLRFQGFLALAQAAAAPGGPRIADGLSGLASEVGYADQAHLTRECVRLSGQTPRQLLHGAPDHCACGHDHAASYRPFLGLREMFKHVGQAAP